MSIFRRLGLAVVVVAALAVWPASGASAGSRQVPLGGTGAPQTGGFTPSGAGDVTQAEFPTGDNEPGPDPYNGTISLSTGTGSGPSVSVVLPGAAVSWHVPVASGRAVRRTSASGGYPGHHPARATFLATWPGRAVLSSVDDIACLHTKPPCAVAQRSWRVVVFVTGPHS